MNILRCAPCTEFKVRDELHRLGIAALVPVEFTVSKFSRGKEAIRKSPVVRGYVFASITDWMAISRVRGIKGAVTIDGAPYTLTRSQTDALELLSRPLQRSNRSGWSPGDKVRVRRGAYTELEAVVQDIKKGKVVVVTSLFGKQMEVTVPAEQLEAA